MNKVKELKIWQKSMELSKMIYEVTSELPNDEKYSLMSQMKRSAISIPSNIAEGAGRNSNKEFIHFLSIANGSAYELETQLLLTIDLNLLKKNHLDQALALVTEIQKMNYSLQKSLNTNY